MKTEVLNNFGTSENLNNKKKEFLSFDIPIALTQVRKQISRSLYHTLLKMLQKFRLLIVQDVAKCT